MPPRKPRKNLTTAARRSQRKTRSSANSMAVAATNTTPLPQPLVRTRPCPRPRPRPRPPPVPLPSPVIQNGEPSTGSVVGAQLLAKVDELDEWNSLDFEPLELLDKGEDHLGTPAYSELEFEVIETHLLDTTKDAQPKSKPNMNPKVITHAGYANTTGLGARIPVPRPSCALSVPSSPLDSSPILLPVDQVASTLKDAKRVSGVKPKPSNSQTGQGKKAESLPDFGFLA
ncbi:hypothetical protein RSOLAG1IB_10229 [Rhizoctonia solani AG-1 IB]|uniref:Uncharacterized protein n=1 Tax=Thanatephorus cucumeris (strain AG1-IB / isolate 7/3/14) TaxID=1108050 RepID=A0A0B7FWR7_THACB|nr:hypothetical protein RSOLAG1IB_10229 [Rhizoctonia solani AG-1 IB]